MKNDAIIFDLDGTLWDTTAPCAEAWNSAVSKLKVAVPHITPKKFESIMGKTFEDCVATLYPDLPASQRETVGAECLKEEIETIRRAGASFYPGVREGIPKLAEKFPLYIVSNCMVDYMELFFEISGFQRWVKDWECYGRTLYPKDHNIQSVVKRHSLKKPVYIGDTPSDMRAAAAARVDYWHVNYGFGGKINASSFDDFNELVDYFLHQ